MFGPDVRAEHVYPFQGHLDLVQKDFTFSVKMDGDAQLNLDVKRRLGKLPLRHSLARHVKHQTWTKRPFTVPMDAWLRGPLRQIFEETLLDRREILGLPLNQEGARAMFERHLSGQANYELTLWMLLSLALWEERHRLVRTHP